MYEDKVRLADWLRLPTTSHTPTTWVFFDRSEAEAFAASCPLPIVTKTAFGAAATGVRILRSRRQVRAVVARAFGRGVLANGADLRDRQWGGCCSRRHVDVAPRMAPRPHRRRLLRPPEGAPWRLPQRLGRVAWERPRGAAPRPAARRHRERAASAAWRRRVRDPRQGDLLVNELQTVFGAGTSVDQMRVDGAPGRMVRSRGRLALRGRRLRAQRLRERARRGRLARWAA
jgi:hypothetical protein